MRDLYSRKTYKRFFSFEYPFAKKGWRVYNLETGSVTVSRNVVFLETEFGFSDLPVSLTPTEQIEQQPIVDLFETDHLIPKVAAPIPITTYAATTSGITDSGPTDQHYEHDRLLSPPAIPTETTLVSIGTMDATNSAADLSVSSPAAVIPEPEPELLGRGMRQNRPPTRLADYVATMLHNPPPSVTPYPLDNSLSSEQFSTNYQAFLGIIMSAVEPRSYAKAILDEKWRFAVTHEIDSLEDQGTWTFEALPPGKKAPGCKWVFKIKFRADGTIEQYKARLVVLGNHQMEGIDYNETFAPVAKMVAVRTFL